MAGAARQYRSQNRTNRNRRKIAPGVIIAAFAAIGLVILAGTLLYTGKLRIPQSAGPTAGQETTGRKPAAAMITGEYQRLVGRWVRPDGGYVIDIRKIAADGTTETYYYNPRSIKVSRAAASRVGATTKVFIELRDIGYPGATYTLVYKPQEDVLAGVYFQPAVGQSFNVVFFRKQ